MRQYVLWDDAMAWILIAWRDNNNNWKKKKPIHTPYFLLVPFCISCSHFFLAAVKHSFLPHTFTQGDEVSDQPAKGKENGLKTFGGSGN